MHSIDELQALIEEAIAKKTYNNTPSQLFEPINYILSIGGKRIRPALLLMACEAFNGDVHRAMDAALSIEVFHNFTLMHDDIMDQAPLRRGHATVHSKWNQNVAILSGDVMLIEAYKLIMSVDDSILRKTLDTLNSIAVDVCRGQQIDMNFETQQQVSIDEYLEMIRLKTAVVLGGAMKIGAYIGGADEASAAGLQQFAENIGIAFQLQDDILDVYADPGKFGKRVGGDILANKKTYLLIRAQELAHGAQASTLGALLHDTLYEPDEKVQQVTRIFDELNVREAATSAMQHYADKAFKALEQVNVDTLHKQYLHDFASRLMVRES